jgi:type IV pilus assembly protein PilX
MKTSPPLSRPLRKKSHKQAGVVLIVSMVMLVIISLASVAIMRHAMGADAVSDNNRRNNQAMQAAQAALLYCENKILTNTLTPAQKTTTAAPTENWKQFSSWSATGTMTNGGPVNVPDSELMGSATEQTRFTATNRPQCMAQHRVIPGTLDTVIVVTARGFSDDYQQAGGHTTAGSVVWLQSIIRLAAEG